MLGDEICKLSFVHAWTSAHFVKFFVSTQGLDLKWIKVGFTWGICVRSWVIRMSGTLTLRTSALNFRFMKITNKLRSRLWNELNMKVKTSQKKIQNKNSHRNRGIILTFFALFSGFSCWSLHCPLDVCTCCRLLWGNRSHSGQNLVRRSKFRLFPFFVNEFEVNFNKIQWIFTIVDKISLKGRLENNLLHNLPDYYLKNILIAERKQRGAVKEDQTCLSSFSHFHVFLTASCVVLKYGASNLNRNVVSPYQKKNFFLSNWKTLKVVSSER